MGKGSGGKVALLLILGVIFIGLVSAAAYFFLVDTGDPATQKYWYECTVRVKEDLVGTGVSIDTANCQRVRTCGFLPFNAFTAEGQVEMWDTTGKLSSKNYETGLFSGEDILTLTGCSRESQFRVRLYDDARNLIQEEIA